MSGGYDLEALLCPFLANHFVKGIVNMGLVSETQRHNTFCGETGHMLL